MGLLSGVGALLKQFTGNNPATAEQFEQLTQGMPTSSIAGGLAEVFRSVETPPFAQLAAQLFSNGNGQQQASVLNTLLAALGPSLLSKFAGNNTSSPLASLLQSGQTAVSVEQAATVKPEEVQALAEEAEKHDSSVIDKLSHVYAEHPELIKSLGAAALTIAAAYIAKQHETTKQA